MSHISLSLCLLALLLAVSLRQSFASFDYRRLLPPEYTPESEQSYFAICMVIKDDADFFEWFEYHRRMGTSKFYVYDNGSNPPMNNTMWPHINSGLIEYMYWPDKYVPNVQIRAYADCLERFKNRHRFMGFIDVDEFIVVANHTQIPTVLKNYESYGGLALHWMVFGSSGHDRRPAGGVINNYWKCTQNNHVKSIVNTKYGISPTDNTHSFVYRPPFHAVNVHGKRVPSAWSDPPVYDDIYINHYVTKSKEDCEQKISRGAGDGSHKTWEWFNRINSIASKNCPKLMMPPNSTDSS